MSCPLTIADLAAFWSWATTAADGPPPFVYLALALLPFVHRRAWS